MQEFSKKPQYDPILFARNMADVAIKTQAIINKFVLNHPLDPGEKNASSHIGKAFLELTGKMLSDPNKLVKHQLDLWKQYMQLWQHSADKFIGKDAKTPLPDMKDKRFKDPAWQKGLVFDFISQSYLLTAQWLQNTLNNVEGMDKKNARKVDFYARQFIDALSPSNFLMTNPQVLKAALESNGETLKEGLTHLLEDLEHGNGRLQISMTDKSAFEIGKNIAITPGKVVYKNALIELIQYIPSTDSVYETPILIIPAWINKYYILDLQPENSFVKWLVDKGHTVFVISWVNPSEKLASKTFEDYLNEGPIAALDVVEKITGQKQINTVGYCLGGTLLATTIAYLHAKKKAACIASATYLTTMLDFSDSGELAVFIDEEQIKSMEERMNKKGYLEGAEMAMTFNMLRANDLIWSFVVNNYLLGKDPFPFDLLYWNADATRMPAAMHSFYLRNMYQQNRLVAKESITLNATKIDITTIKTPSFFLSTREDHIAPWASTYAGALRIAGNVEFVLAASGHIAGVINPPQKNKYCYWTNDVLPEKSDDWLKTSKEQNGSWWPYWEGLLQGFSKNKVPARACGSNEFKPISDAPGEYVKVKS